MQNQDSFTLRVVSTADDLAQNGADVVIDVVANKPDAVIALPTGSTPLGMFSELVRRIRSGEADFS